MGTRTKRLAAGAALALGAIGVGGPVAVSAQTPVMRCGVLAAPGSYVLVNNITAAGTCITITASGVTFDLGGFTISGGCPNTVGIEVPGNAGNTTIQNGTVTGFGIDVDVNASSVTVSSLTASSACTTGVSLSTPTNLDTISNVTATGNGSFGIDAISPTNLNVGGVTVTNNGGTCPTQPCAGMRTLSGNMVQVQGTFSNNNLDGLQVNGSIFVAVNNVTANANAGSGIDFQAVNGFTMSNVTANGNVQRDGVFIGGSTQAAIVTQSTASGNGRAGFEVALSTGVTLSTETANNNGAYGAVLLGVTSSLLNFVQASGNTIAGIYLGATDLTLPPPPAQTSCPQNALPSSGNSVIRNTVGSNAVGIGIQCSGGNANTVQLNTALGDTNWDLYDGTLGCGTPPNAWTGDTFITGNQKGVACVA